MTISSRPHQPSGPHQSPIPAPQVAPAGGAAAAIRTENLSRTFGSVRAVHSVSLALPPHAITGLVGPNGAGKSTLLRMILGLTRPDTGRVTVLGHVYRDLDAPGRTVGSLLSAEDLPHRSSIRGFLTYVADTQGIPRDRVASVLEQVGLSSASRTRIRQCSLGMRQRVGLAAALLGEPRVLVLDEPLNGLDPDAIIALRSQLRSLADGGTTIVLSSHLMSELARVVDHVVMLRGGELLAAGPLSDFEDGSGQTLEEAYLHHMQH